MPAYVEKELFGIGYGTFEGANIIRFGMMVHGYTYPNEIVSDADKGKMYARYWTPVMEKGETLFSRPEECESGRVVKKSDTDV